MRSCNCSLLLLLLFSVLLLSHAATVTKRRNGTVDRRYMDRNFTPYERLGFSSDRMLKIMEPPPNCTVSETGSFFDEPDPQHHSRMECFLWKLKVAIPQQSFEKDWITITVHDMVCTNFLLHGLQSNSSAHDDWSALQVSVHRISATCQGQYHSTGGLGGNVIATVEESSPPSPALGLLFDIQSKRSADTNTNSGSDNYSYSTANVTLPAAFETKECGTQLGIESIRFSGSISAKMIQTFSGMIGRHITQALQQQICPLMTNTVDPIITEYFNNFDDLIRKYLDEAVAMVDTSDTNDSSSVTRNHRRIEDANLGAKDLVEYPAIRSSLSFLNDQLRNHLQTGWIPSPDVSFDDGGDFHGISKDCIDSLRGISGWIDSILGARPRIKLPKYLRHLVFPILESIGANGTVTLDIPELVVVGLDQMDALQVLEPSSSESKDLQTKLVTREGFFVVLPVKLKIRWPTLEGDGVLQRENSGISIPPTLQESFKLTINVTHIDATLSSLIQLVDWESTSLLQVVDAVQRFVESRNIHDLACLFRTLHNVKLSRDGTLVFHDILIETVQISRDKKEAPKGSLEADLDHTINTVLDLFLSDYAGLWTQLLKGLVRGPGSRGLNRFVEGWIKKHSGDDSDGGKCPPATRSPAKLVNFTKFEILNTMNRYLEHSHTIKSTNDFFRCLAETVEYDVDGDDDPAYDRVTDRNGLGFGRDGSAEFIRSVDTNKILTNFNLGFPAPFPNIFEDIMNIFADLGEEFLIQDNNTDTRVALSRIELRNWDSVQRLQLLKPSGDTSLTSSMVFGKMASLEGVEDGDIALSLMASNASGVSVSSSSKGPPEITLVINVGGYKISGQANLTLFATLDANVDVNIDYDLNRLENLTISHLFEEINCALLPATQVRFLPGTTNLAFGKYFGANLTASISGRNFSLSTKDYPRFLEISDAALSWTQEFSRTMVNYVVEGWIDSSSGKCPGVVLPDDDTHHDKNKQGGKPIYWLDRDSTILWIVFGVIVVMQGGLVFVYRIHRREGDVQEPNEANSSESVETAVRSNTPLLSTYQELMSHPSPETVENNRVKERNNSIDDCIIQDICEDLDDENEDEPQGILEDQLIEESHEFPKVSIFDSDEIPEYIKCLVPAMIIGTIVLLFTSNLSNGASVDLSVDLGERSINIPGLFQFSLRKTASEMYVAGIYPLLILVVCFSGIWPYAKLFLMLHAWMRPTADQHRQERRLLTLDAMGKYSLVDNYVLILFVVAFRYHLEISDNLGIDVYVTPIYGFFSFLLATCLSLILGHAVLFFHRKTAQPNCEDNGSPPISLLLNHGFKIGDEISHKRLSRILQGLLPLLLVSTLWVLVRGFSQESYTFEIGGLAGMMLGEDGSRTTYSVLSLGSALSSSVEDSQSPSIVFLQGTFFFFTVVTPILCLVLMLVLMTMPLTLTWQRYVLIATEIANSWSAVEVFLLSILAALFQISTFASFMIGDKCDEINILAKKIFDEENTGITCFTVNTSVESNCWYLLVGAFANFLLVSFCLNFAETAVEEKLEDSCSGQESSSSSETMPNTTKHHKNFLQKLHDIPSLRSIVFASVPDSHLAPEEGVVPLEDRVDGT